MPDKCFVLMPFTEPFNDYYKTILVPAIKAAGFESIRADEIYGTKPIIEDIFDNIRNSTALVADVTGKNPNVNYELGVAHALNRPVVILSQSIDDIPFDYRHLRAIIYDTKKVDWVSELMSKITNTLRSITPSYLSFGNPLGIKRIYRDCTEIDFLGLIRLAEKGEPINLLGIIMTNFNNRAMQSAIEEKLKLGCDVKMLLLSPNSKFVEHRAQEENRDYQEWKNELVAVNQSHRNFISRLPEDIRKHIELGHYDGPPTFSVYLIGKIMLVGFYLRENQGAYLPYLELDVKEKGIYEPFLKHFNAMWNSREGARPIQEGS
jgi:Domain of unknown function (DUF5919)